MYLEFKICPVQIKTTEVTSMGPLLPEKPRAENKNRSGDRALSSSKTGSLIEDLQPWLHAHRWDF